MITHLFLTQKKTRIPVVWCTAMISGCIPNCLSCKPRWSYFMRRYRRYVHRSRNKLNPFVEGRLVRSVLIPPGKQFNIGIQCRCLKWKIILIIQKHLCSCLFHDCNKNLTKNFTAAVALKKFPHHYGFLYS